MRMCALMSLLLRTTVHQRTVVLCTTVQLYADVLWCTVHQRTVVLWYKNSTTVVRFT